MHNFFKGFLVSLALLFLVGCHHNAHIRTQKPLSPSETVFSGSITTLPISLGFGDDTPLGIIGMRSELSLLRGLENDQELGAYAGLGLGRFIEGGVLGLHYKRYKYIPPIGRLVKIGGGLEINTSHLGTVFNSKTSIISTSSKKSPRYGGIHLLYAKSFGNLREYNYDYEPEIYTMFSAGIGMTIGKEREFFLKNTTLQSQFDVSAVYDHKFDYDYTYDSVYLVFSTSFGFSFFHPPSKPEKSFDPLPPIQKRNTKSSPDIMSNTSTKLFDPETGEVIKKESLEFDPETGEVIKKESLEFDPETGEVID